MSSFGTYFRVTTFGESHGKSIGAIIENVPPRLPLTEADIQPQLDRRRPGQSSLTTARDESDTVAILSGTEGGLTLGTPVALSIPNKDTRPGDYGGGMSSVPRPSHADYTYLMKYGVAASSGGGRASARETAARVAAGAIAEKWLGLVFGTQIVAYVSGVGRIELDPALVDETLLTRADVDAHLVRCPHGPTADAMAEEIKEVRAADDSTGGVISCVIRGVPVGWGEPCFDKLEGLLAHAMLSIPSTKGFEVGSGFAGARMRGSEHNDAFVAAVPPPPPQPSASSPPGTASTAATPLPPRSPERAGAVGMDCSQVTLLATVTNNSGGIQGGISNGAFIRFRVAFKPPATIGQAQLTSSYSGETTVLEAKGRHDPCVVPRAVAIVEAMAALVLADCALEQMAREAAAATFPRVVPSGKAAE